MSGGLLAKLRQREQREPPLSPAASIRAHLSELLNARQGDSALDPLYGLPDLTDLTHCAPEGVPVLQRSIAELVRRHEPRLTKVSVSSANDALRGPRPCLCFELQAELVTGGTLRIHTELTPGGRVHVS